MALGSREAGWPRAGLPGCCRVTAAPQPGLSPRTRGFRWRQSSGYSAECVRFCSVRRSQEAELPGQGKQSFRLQTATWWGLLLCVQGGCPQPPPQALCPSSEGSTSDSGHLAHAGAHTPPGEGCPSPALTQAAPPWQGRKEAAARAKSDGPGLSRGLVWSALRQITSRRPKSPSVGKQTVPEGDRIELFLFRGS